MSFYISAPGTLTVPRGETGCLTITVNGCTPGRQYYFSAGTHNYVPSNFTAANQPTRWHGFADLLFTATSSSHDFSALINAPTDITEGEWLLHVKDFEDSSDNAYGSTYVYARNPGDPI